jgi:hypothetical protein
MTKEDFYARALLSVFPAAIEENPHDVHGNPARLMSYVDECAALLTNTFERNRAKYQGK